MYCFILRLAIFWEWLTIVHPGAGIYTCIRLHIVGASFERQILKYLGMVGTQHVHYVYLCMYTERERERVITGVCMGT